MALYDCTIKYDMFSSEVNQIIYSEDPLTLQPKKQGISSSHVKRFYYEIESIIAPHLLKIRNQKYIIPNWQPVHPNTELADIIWMKPKSDKVIVEKEQWEFLGSDGVSRYFVRKTGNQFKCTCPGYYRSFTRECKHIKECKLK